MASVTWQAHVEAPNAATKSAQLKPWNAPELSMDHLILNQTELPSNICSHEGHAVYTIRSAPIDVKAGQIVIFCKGVPHEFFNSGQTRLRQTDIHLSKRFETEWLAA